MADFGYCFDCNELNYAITDSNGVYERNKMADNHWEHNVHVFGKPEDYCPPIRNVLTKLHAMLPISHNEIVLFNLAVDLGELDKFNMKKIEAGKQALKEEQTLTLF